MTWCAQITYGRTWHSGVPYHHHQTKMMPPKYHHLEVLLRELCLPVVWWILLDCVHAHNSFHTTYSIPRWVKNVDSRAGWWRGYSHDVAKTTDLDSLVVLALAPFETHPGNWTSVAGSEEFPSVSSNIHTLWKMGQTHQRLCPENHQKAKISFSSDASFRGLFTQGLTKYNDDWNVTKERQSWQQGEPLKFITGATEKVFKPWSLVSWASGCKWVQGGIHNITYFYTR